MIAVNTNTSKKFLYRHESVTAEGLRAFGASLLDGSADVDYKSGPLPAEPKEDGVTVVVGNNFNDVVLDKTKDVLLEVGGTRRLNGGGAQHVGWVGWVLPC